MDPLDKARGVVEESKLEFPLAHGLQVPQDAERIGAWWDENPKRPMIQPSEFILGRARDDGSRTILSATYSTGPIGRLKAEDVLALLQYFDSQRK